MASPCLNVWSLEKGWDSEDFMYLWNGVEANLFCPDVILCSFSCYELLQDKCYLLMVVRSHLMSCDVQNNTNIADTM